jgi:AbrB family looped-hinge helix DNA binding protein
MNMSATITSKGQTTIPKAIRDRLNLKTGDRVEFVVEEDGRVVLVPATSHVTELKGIMPRPKKVASLEEMEAAIQIGVSRRFKDAK